MRLMRFRQKKESNINRLQPIEANPLILNDLFFSPLARCESFSFASQHYYNRNSYPHVKSQCCVVTKARNYVTLLHLDCK